VPSSAIELSWIVFLLFWVVSARNAGTPVRRDTSRARFTINIILLIGGVLLSGGIIALGPLDRHFVEAVAWASGIAMVFVVGGLALAVWARIHLGRFWTGDVGIVDRPELIREGPYARIRHPIYTGVLLAAAGTALGIGEIRAVIGFALLFVGLYWKALREEGFLLRAFGRTYEEYRERAGFLLPKINPR
jgi:protein-S-isoprenylcysteine O-methyltransferase Ste14